MSENNLIKLGINNRKIAGKFSNKNIILYNPWSQRWSLEENWKILFWSGWKYKYNIWKCMEWSLTVLQRKFVALNTCIGKEEKSQINNLSFHLRETGKWRGILTQRNQKESKGRSEIHRKQNKILKKKKKKEIGNCILESIKLIYL